MDKVVIIIDGEYRKVRPERGRGFTVGRAFSNDVIVADDYIGPQQLDLHLSEGEEGFLIVENMDNTNPVFLNKRLVENRKFELKSGDELTIGKSTIQFYADDHPVGEARQFSLANWLHNHKFKPVIACLMVLVLYGVVVWDAYSEIFDEPVWGQVAAKSVFPVVIAFVWALAWALAGKFMKANHYFFSHLFFAVSLLALAYVTGEVYSFADYLFSSTIAGMLVGSSIMVVCLGLLIGFHLMLVTHKPKSFRRGFYVSIAVIGLMTGVSHFSQSEYSNYPQHTRTIKAPWVPSPAASTPDAHIRKYGELFKSLEDE